MYMHSEWKQRVQHWIYTLKKDLFLPLGKMKVEAFQTMDHLTPQEALAHGFSPMADGTLWGHTWEYCWMHGKIVIPPEAEGCCVAVDVKAGGEATLFVNGRSFGTYRNDWVRIDHHYIVDNFLTSQAHAGEEYDLLAEVYAGHWIAESKELGGCATGPVLPGDYGDPKTEGQRACLQGITYGIWNEDAYQLFLDMHTLLQLGESIDPESLRADRVAEALEKATLMVDFEQPLENRIADYRAAREMLKEVLQAVNGTTTPVFYAIGNAHLDLAWLWPMAETRRKTSRTFAQQLRLIEKYPEYKYIQSQPAGYEMCRECYPELFERILEAQKKGQWIAEGAMWVEPDTNMTSGESLVRQVLHGKRWFKDVMGVDSVVLWLPDTFGYSAALPQILKKTGVKYLVTQKIFWSYNEGERFPYHYFTWRGADGTEIDSFLPTSYTYFTDPKAIADTWKDRAQKRDLNAFLLPFGYGDGGGGPTRDHIEYLLREKDLEGMPRVKIEGPVQFFEDMEKQGGPKRTYVGELYFSAHRGVYTSQGAIKRGNRKAELGLREAEMWGSLAMLIGQEYPLGRMDAAWKRLLLNQFHDILPGSSIGKVYEDARRDHQWIIGEAEAVRDGALKALAKGEGATVFNSLSFERTEVVELPEAFADGAVTDRGEEIHVRKQGEKVLAQVTVPSCGAVSLMPKKSYAAPEAVRACLTEDGAVLENDCLRAVLNARGEIISLKDRLSGREFAAEGLNRLRMYKDVPRLFDAWDIDSNYILQPVELDEPVTLTVKEQGGLRAVLHLSRKIQNSSLEQDIVLTAGSRRIDFETCVDWHELHRLLKADFSFDVRATEGLNEIQFGYMARPTHRSRLYDSDRFEVCNQRWSALCDENHGAAVLNDCKYGISMNDNALQLTLLRAGACPEMRADNGTHVFTYAVTCWDGSFMDSPVIREAVALNVPVLVTEGRRESFSAFGVSAENVMIDTVKPAEDGSGDLVLRLYEAKKADTDCCLKLGIRAEQIWECDMLENREQELTAEDGCVKLHFHTFEVKTLRLKPAVC